MSNFVTLSFDPASPTEFVEFWRRGYRAKVATYDQNIRENQPLSTDNVVALMRWKAGNRFAAAAEGFARAVPVELLNASREAKVPLTDEAVRDLYDRITSALHAEDLGWTEAIVWRLFLCHLAQPQSIPIYDRYVWRAWGFITEWIEPHHYLELPATLDTYLEFRRWWNDAVQSDGLDRRRFYQALMAFGQFLSNRWGRLLR
jgi:hypothetical protein